MKHERRYSASPVRTVRVAVMAAVAPVLACILSSTPVPLAARAQARPQPSGSATTSRAPAPDSLIGTVRRVDVRGGTIDLITGVGYALRVQRVPLPRQPKVLADGRVGPWPVPGLAPGAVVRVRFRRTESGAVPASIEVLPAPSRGTR